MSKAAVAAICGTIAAAAVLSAVQLNRLGGTLESLDARIARVESATGAAPDPASPDPAAPGARARTGDADGLAAEIAKLRAEIASLRAASAGGKSGTAGSGDEGVAAREPGKPAGALSKDELASAVQEAMRSKEQADREKQAKLTRKQTELSAKQWAKGLSGKLGLTEQQTQKLGEIFAEGWLKMSLGWQEAQENENAEPYDYQALQKEMNENARAILTPEQAAKYDELMKQKNTWMTDEGDEGEEAK